MDPHSIKFRNECSIVLHSPNNKYCQIVLRAETDQFVIKMKNVRIVSCECDTVIPASISCRHNSPVSDDEGILIMIQINVTLG